jgi:hypothetical protein
MVGFLKKYCMKFLVTEDIAKIDNMECIENCEMHVNQLNIMEW